MTAENVTGPIIIIGAARSGTKFLRDVLAASPDAAAVPYDVNYVWRYKAGDADDDVLDPATLTPARADFIRKTLPTLARARPGQVLIEKTVSNSLRVPFVAAVFPDARFVHLIRDGRDVTESAMRQWQAPPNWKALWQKLRGIPLANLGYVFWFAGNFVSGLFSGRKGGNVWGPRFPGIMDLAGKADLAEICARQWVASVERASADLAALPEAGTRVFEIRYEDLIADEAALRDLAEKLDLADPDAVVASFKKRLRPGEPAQWRALPGPDLAILQTTLTPTLTANGYAT